MRRDTPAVALAGLLFLLSGVAALVYQVAWQRLLALHSGVGPLLGGDDRGRVHGRPRHRQPPRRPPEHAPRRSAALAAFRALEIGDRRVRRGEHVPSTTTGSTHAPSTCRRPRGTAGLLHFAALLPPTTLMGMSLPFLVAGGRARRRGGAGGGSAGSTRSTRSARRPARSPTPWVLCPHLGLRGASAARPPRPSCVVGPRGARPLARRRPRAGAPPAGGGPRRGAPRPRPRPRAAGPSRSGSSLYAVSGFVRALAGDRVVPPPRRGRQVHGLRLRHRPRRLPRRLGHRRAHRRAGASTACAGRCGPSSRASARSSLYAALPARSSSVAHPRTSGGCLVRRLLGDYDFFTLGRTSRSAERRSGSTSCCPLLLFLVPTILMGLSFPILQRAVHDDPRNQRPQVGVLQAANIVGCVAGSLLVGLLASSTSARRARCGCSSSSASCSPSSACAATDGAFVAPALLLAALAVALPGAGPLWRRLHGSPRACPEALFDEDATSVVAVIPDGRGLPAVGQRQGQQLAARSGAAAAQPARGLAGDRAPRAAPSRRHRPRLGRHRLGGRVPHGDALADRLRDLGAAAADPAAARRPRGLPTRGTCSTTRASRSASRTAARRSRRGGARTTSSRRTPRGPRPRAAATSTRSSSSPRPRAG